ncbi:MAG: PaaI family thioesterase [Ectothiorhodospiraceae bacterium]|nr:PaaI family thioesterase [Ectothiorhodospiraceae bacterium]
MQLRPTTGRRDPLWSFLFRFRPVRDYAARRFFSGTPHCRELGLRVLGVEPRRLRACMDWREDLVGDPVNGYLHGGVITTLADQVSGAAASLCLRPPEVVATLDLRIDHLRAVGQGATLVAEAHVYRITRPIVFVRCLIHDGDPGNPAAVCASAFVRKGPMTRRYRAVKPAA